MTQQDSSPKKWTYAISPELQDIALQETQGLQAIATAKAGRKIAVEVKSLIVGSNISD